MITVKTLKQLLDKLPDDALVNAYEGEDTGISIIDKSTDKYWWISACEKGIDTLTEGFDEIKIKKEA